MKKLISKSLIVSLFFVSASFMISCTASNTPDTTGATGQSCGGMAAKEEKSCDKCGKAGKDCACAKAQAEKKEGCCKK